MSLLLVTASAAQSHAAAMTSQQVVDGLMTIVVAASPVALKYFPLDGPKMALASFAIPAVIAVIAGAVTGQYDGLDLNSAQSWVITAGWLWAVQQGAYHTLIATVPAAVSQPTTPIPVRGKPG